VPSSIALPAQQPFPVNVLIVEAVPKLAPPSVDVHWIALIGATGVEAPVATT
jgi:hypothetical protein